jgi:HSP20 family protein
MMSAIIRRNPERDLISLRDVMSRMMDDSLLGTPWAFSGLADEMLSIDLYETDDAVMVKAVLPGVKPDDVEISVTRDMLSIRGELKEESEVEEAKVYHRERRYGRFNREIALPVPVIADEAEAEFADGILTLSLPKVEEVKPKLITVKAK